MMEKFCSTFCRFIISFSRLHFWTHPCVAYCGDKCAWAKRWFITRTMESKPKTRGALELPNFPRVESKPKAIIKKEKRRVRTANISRSRLFRIDRHFSLRKDVQRVMRRPKESRRARREPIFYRTSAIPSFGNLRSIFLLSWTAGPLFFWFIVFDRFKLTDLLHVRRPAGACTSERRGLQKMCLEGAEIHLQQL